MTGERSLHVARYYNSGGFAMAIVAVVMTGIDWGAYANGCDASIREKDAEQWVAENGCKLSEADARYFFPGIELPYRA